MDKVRAKHLQAFAQFFDVMLNVFFNGGTPKFGAQAIRKAYDLGWHPLQFLASVSTSVSAVLTPAGLDKARGIISIGYLKDPTDPQWQSDPGFRDWLAFMQKEYPEGNIADNYNVTGYSLAHLDLALPMLLPGIRIRTAPDDFRPLKEMRLERFDGQIWVPFTDIISG